MKKILFAAMAALAITSCSQNEIDGIDNGQNEKNLINFNSIVKKGSRATVVDLPGLKDDTEGFHVYTYNTKEKDAGTGELTTVIMNDELVSYDTENNTWKSTNTHYWPATDKLQFFAFYAPKTTTMTLTAGSNNYPEIKDYTIAALASDQEDLIVASVLNATKSTANGTVTFGFTHALTQVNFSAKPKTFITGLTYTITSMSIKDVVNKGTYNYNTLWIPSTAPENKTTYTIFKGSQEITTAAPVQLNTEAFMLLPQTCDATILVTYSVTDNKGQVLYTGTDKTVKTNMKWEPNKNIRYTIELTDDITPLSFNVNSVTDWGNEIPVTETPNNSPTE